MENSEIKSIEIVSIVEITDCLEPLTRVKSKRILFSNGKEHIFPLGNNINISKKQKFFYKELFSGKVIIQ